MIIALRLLHNTTKTVLTDLSTSIEMTKTPRTGLRAKQNGFGAFAGMTGARLPRRFSIVSQ